MWWSFQVYKKAIKEKVLNILCLEGTGNSGIVNNTPEMCGHLKKQWEKV